MRPTYTKSRSEHPMQRRGDIHEEPGVGTVESFPLKAEESELISLIDEIFLYWKEISFGPIIQGAAYEIRAPQRPITSVLDGYLTLDFGKWHIHLCVGETKGEPGFPTDPAVAEIRRCSKVELYRLVREEGPVSWGCRMFNGLGEQMLTVLLPNPFLDGKSTTDKPDWRCLDLWNHLRLKFLGIQPDDFDQKSAGFIHG